jgi:tRNA (guanine37-N1)-methyltransferase
VLDDGDRAFLAALGWRPHGLTSTSRCLHHPVYDKNGAVVTTAVTNLDVHDIGRLARTFEAPLSTSRRPCRRPAASRARHAPLEHGPGRRSTTRRVKDARWRACAWPTTSTPRSADVRAARRAHLPHVVATTAREGDGRLTSPRCARGSAPGPRGAPRVLDGWCLTAEVLERADAILEPIRGRRDYNHLSVRSAGLHHP